MNTKAAPSVYFLIVAEDHDQQRIDNFLFSKLKGLPKSRVYRALRKGEVRVNKKRISACYKLKAGDEIRIPPLRIASITAPPRAPSARLLAFIEQRIILEDRDFILVNKPAGVAVHGGSGISFGVIEALRSRIPKIKFLELVHRLDKDTSGCLLIAKKSSVLKEVQALLAARQVNKTYLLLVAGKCSFEHKVVDIRLQKNILASGERMVAVHPDGKSARTVFKRVQHIGEMTLLEARPITGRTHQIRVHAAYMGHPILGDEKYCSKEMNKKAKSLGIHSLCLHSSSMEFYLGSQSRPIGICAILQEDWRSLI